MYKVRALNVVILLTIKKVHKNIIQTEGFCLLSFVEIFPVLL